MVKLLAVFWPLQITSHPEQNDPVFLHNELYIIIMYSWKVTYSIKLWNFLLVFQIIVEWWEIENLNYVWTYPVKQQVQCQNWPVSRLVEGLHGWAISIDQPFLVFLSFTSWVICRNQFLCQRDMDSTGSKPWLSYVHARCHPLLPSIHSQPFPRSVLFTHPMGLLVLAIIPLLTAKCDFVASCVVV